MAHHHHGCYGEHDHDHPQDPAVLYRYISQLAMIMIIFNTDSDKKNSCSLYQKIDTEKLQCLNEAVEGSGRTIFKPWEERFDRNKVLYFNTVHLLSFFFY
jgi:hypothetical protein